MIFAWTKKHLAAVISGAAIAVVLSLVVTIAITSTGYTTQRVDLGDASTWVVNDSEQAIGRLNTQISALDTAKRSDRRVLSVVQNDSTVLLHAVDQKELGIVNESLATVDDQIQLPADSTNVFLTKDTAVIHSSPSGRVWFLPSSSLATFNAEAEADMVLGDNSAAAADDNGRFIGYSVGGGLVERQIGPRLGDPKTTKLNLGDEKDIYSAAVVSGHPVVLNVTKGTLSIDGGQPSTLNVAENPVLMQSSTSADAVYVSDSKGMLRIGFGGGQGERLFTLDQDAPQPSAAPVYLDTCVFGAWTNGTAWRNCGADEALSMKLSEMSPDSQLVFASRAGYTVLNDEQSGRSWMVQDSGQLVNNWDKILQDVEDDQKQEVNDPTLPPEVDPVQKPPVASDDAFGARPGRASPLPVLLNDFDPNGDVLVITEISNFPEGMGTASLIENGQKVQVNLAADAVGTFDFRYTVTDGQGGQASANVTVEVRQPNENNPPVQARQTTQAVASLGQFNRDVLVDWYDPDGDPFFLADASIAAPDVATYSSKGVVYYQDSGQGSPQKSIGLSVSDGTLATAGSLDLEVMTGAVPITAEAVAVLGNVGQEVMATPLDYVRGGNGNVRLTGVPDDNLGNAKLKVNTDTGEVRLTANEPGSYLLEYKVGDGTNIGSGKLRFDISALPDQNLPPVTVPASTFLYLDQTDTIDVLAADYDPAGGVLLLRDVTNPLADKGLIVEILNHGMLRVTLTEPLAGGSVELSYNVTNGQQSSRGTVTVLQVAPPPKEKPPVAKPDRVKVRVGEVTNIPVLSNDLHPDRLALTLSPELAKGLPESEGLLFASGNELRYLAPNTPGEYTASYVVESPGGEIATAPVHISVREVDENSNTAPAPKTVTTRVVQGHTVRIPIPLAGIDDDGDSVTLGGLETAPAKGIVTSTGKDYIEYEAGTNSLGTDSFYYSVTDSLGAVGIGQIRVGVMEASGVAANPVARTDVISARPNSTFVVKPLENDSDPDGGRIDIVSVEKKSELPAKVDKESVTLSVPSKEGSYSVLYTVQNESGGQSSAWIQVSVKKDAPPVRPVVEDTVLTLTDIADSKDSVTADIWKNVFYAEGTDKDLDLSLVPGWDQNAQVTVARSLSIKVSDQNQIIPFRVSVSATPEVDSYGFVWIPGTKNAVPERRTGAPSLTIPTGQKLTINIGDQVIAADNKKVRITDASTVKATNSSGANLFKDDGTIEFVSQEEYWGPASVTFEVTDAPAGSDQGRKAIIVLPITVTPISNQPPTIRGAAFTLEPTGDRTVDLAGLTTYPYPKDMNKLVWSQPQSAGDGAAVTLSNDKLSIKVDKATPVGAVINVPIGVRDDKSQVATANVQVTVVSSTKPKVQALPDTVELTRGSSKTVDVLANDVGPEELKPFTVVGVDVVSAARGVTASPSADKRNITISAAKEADITANLQLTYRVQDATGQSERIVTGTVTAVIVDVPDAPGAPDYMRQDVFQNDGKLRLSFTSNSSNGKPIDSYLLRSTDGSVEVNCGRDNSSCTISDGQAKPGVTYQFTAIAVNSIGRSEPSSPGAPVRIDYVPEAPINIAASAPAANNEMNPTNAGQLDISWSPGAANKGAPASSYQVSVYDGSGALKWDRKIPASGAGFQGVTAEGPFAPGEYRITIEARNDIDAATYGAVSWKSGSVSGVQAKKAPSKPVITANSRGNGLVSAAWDITEPNGTIRTAVSWSDKGGTPPALTCDAAKNGTGNSSSDQTVSATGQYGVRVVAWNGWACSEQVASVSYTQAPAQPAKPTVQIVQGIDQDHGVAALNLPVVDGVLSYLFSLDGSSFSQVPPGAKIGGMPNSPNRVWIQACGASNGTSCSPSSVPSDLFYPYDVSVKWASEPTAGKCTPTEVTKAVVTAGATIQYGYSAINGGPWVGEWNGFLPVPTGAKEILAKATFTPPNGPMVETRTPIRTTPCE